MTHSPDPGQAMHANSTLPLFVCVLKTGGSYGLQDARALRDSIRRFNPDARLCCLTDASDAGRAEDIEVLPLEQDLPGWFSKLEVFRITDRPFIYVDLDVVFTSRVNVQIPAGLWILRGFKGSGVNSSVLMVNGDFRDILERFIQAREDNIRKYSTSGDFWGDQDVIRDSGHITGYIQDIEPTLAGSWKNTLRYAMGTVRRAPAILVFHGQPKPSEMSIRVLDEGVVHLFNVRYLGHWLYHLIRDRLRGIRR
jgi:hypothetical protein